MCGVARKPLRLTVSGNRVLAGGTAASLSGNSLFWSNNGWGGDKFYNANTIGWLLKSRLEIGPRAAMGVKERGDYLDDPDKAVVDAAIANDMYVIIDWHTHNAEDCHWQAQAIDFFKEMAGMYGKYTSALLFMKLTTSR
jgi:endoglucanase